MTIRTASFDTIDQKINAVYGHQVLRSIYQANCCVRVTNKILSNRQDIFGSAKPMNILDLLADVIGNAFF